MSQFIKIDTHIIINLDCVSTIKTMKDKNDQFIVAFFGDFPGQRGEMTHLATKTFETDEERNAYLKEQFGLEGPWDDRIASGGDKNNNEERRFPERR